MTFTAKFQKLADVMQSNRRLICDFWTDGFLMPARSYELNWLQNGLGCVG